MVSTRDIAQAAKLAGLALLVSFVPPRRWHRLAALMANPLVGRETDPDTPLYARVLGIDQSSAEATEIYRKRRIWRRLVQLQALGLIGVWRSWQPPARLTGREHIDAGLERGSGVILWLSEWASSEIMAKVALHRAGCRATQLSRPEHGFGDGPLLLRWLNPRWMAMEDRYLGGRIAISNRDTAAALAALRRHLADNGVAIITVGSEARRLVEVPFLGDRLRLPTGPARLAQATGAAILPVFPTVLADGSWVIAVDRPLPVPPPAAGPEALRQVAAEYARRLEPFVRANPDQWRGWCNLVPPEPPLPDELGTEARRLAPAALSA